MPVPTYDHVLPLSVDLAILFVPDNGVPTAIHVFSPNAEWYPVVNNFPPLITHDLQLEPSVEIKFD